MPTANNQTYSFTMVLAGVESLDQLETGIYGAGCDDALVGFSCGTAFVSFDREAKNLPSAIKSAIRDIRKMKGVEIDHIEPDDVVSMAEIARRIGQSRESIRKYINGERSNVPFPRPISNVSGSRSLWRWSDVATWLSQTGKAAPLLAEDARFITRLNAALSLARASANEQEIQQILTLVKTSRKNETA